MAKATLHRNFAVSTSTHTALHAKCHLHLTGTCQPPMRLNRKHLLLFPTLLRQRAVRWYCQSRARKRPVPRPAFSNKQTTLSSSRHCVHRLQTGCKRNSKPTPDSRMFATLVWQSFNIVRRVEAYLSQERLSRKRRECRTAAAAAA